MSHVLGWRGRDWGEEMAGVLVVCELEGGVNLSENREHFLCTFSGSANICRVCFLKYFEHFRGPLQETGVARHARQTANAGTSQNERDCWCLKWFEHFSSHADTRMLRTASAGGHGHSRFEHMRTRHVQGQVF